MRRASSDPVMASSTEEIAEPWAIGIRFGLGTGLRWGEMVRAKASDVKQGMLEVSRTKSGRCAAYRPRATCVIESPTGARSFRLDGGTPRL